MADQIAEARKQIRARSTKTDTGSSFWIRARRYGYGRSTVGGVNGIIEWIKQFDIDFGDGPAWVALVVSLGAFAVALRGLKWQKVAAQAAVRSANAAEKAAALTELPPTETATVRDVKWRVERLGKQLYALRNIGADTATGVTATQGEVDAIVRQLPEDTAIRAKASHEFMVIPTWQTSTLREIWVTWDGQAEPVAVPMPA